MVLKLDSYENPLEGLLGPSPVSDWAGLGCDWRVCFAHSFPGDADADGWDPSTENHGLNLHSNVGRGHRPRVGSLSTQPLSIWRAVQELHLPHVTGRGMDTQLSGRWSSKPWLGYLLQRRVLGAVDTPEAWAAQICLIEAAGLRLMAVVSLSPLNSLVITPASPSDLHQLLGGRETCCALHCGCSRRHPPALPLCRECSQHH